METCILSVRASVKDWLYFGGFVIWITAVFCQVEVFRQKDIPLARKLLVMNRTVTCGENNWGVYPFLTYTCDDIKVDGLRLAYGYYPGWGVDENCQETGQKQELDQLCKMLLQRTNKRYSKFMGIVVNNATCRRIEEQRLMIVRTIHRYKWETRDAGHGWLSSLSCMVLP